MSAFPVAPAPLDFPVYVALCFTITIPHDRPTKMVQQKPQMPIHQVVSQTIGELAALQHIETKTQEYRQHVANCRQVIQNVIAQQLHKSKSGFQQHVIDVSEHICSMGYVVQVGC